MQQFTKPVGILGGTFDPIHNGHLHIATKIYRHLDLQAVHLIPCYQPVHRNMPVASASDRLAMVKLATADQAGLIADDREIIRGGPSYMVKTLQSLRQDFPQTPLCLMMATDAFQYFDQWKDWQEIANIAHLVIVNRDNCPLANNTALRTLLETKQIKNPQDLKNNLGGHIYVMQLSKVTISGTDIRNLIAQGKVPQGMLPDDVLSYIQTHSLYL